MNVIINYDTMYTLTTFSKHMDINFKLIVVILNCYFFSYSSGQGLQGAVLLTYPTCPFSKLIAT